MTDDDDLVSALVDADAPDVEAQRTLAKWLIERGVPIDRVRAAKAAGSMTSLVSDAILWRDESRITLTQVAERAGVPTEAVRRARRLIGLVDPGDEPLCRAREIDMFAAFGAGAALFGEERSLQLTRVMGTSSATIAEAAISLFAGAVTASLRVAGATDAEYALTSRDATLAFEGVCDAVDIMLRLHFERANARIGSDVAVNELKYAIAFVDLVDSTAMAGELDGAQIAVALRDFDRLSAEAASRHDVRLVKMIGDGVMLAARDVGSLARATEEIVAMVARHRVLRAARGGVTFGNVAVHDGDYFGQVVNLAARAAGAAVPGEVLVDAEAARHLSRDLEPAGTHVLKGFSHPVALYRLPPP